MSEVIKNKGGAPKKTGLDYFPLFGSIYNSDKMARAKELVDPDGRKHLERMLMSTIVIRIYSIIFARGYFLPWNVLEETEICRQIGDGMNPQFLRSFMMPMLEANLLNKELFEKYNILTSRGLQQKWMRISKSAKRHKPTIAEEHYIVSEKNDFLYDGTPLSSRINARYFGKKPGQPAKETKLVALPEEQKQLVPEETLFTSRTNPDSFLKKQEVPFFNNNSIIRVSNNEGKKDNTNQVLPNNVVEGKVQEETQVSSGRNLPIVPEETGLKDVPVIIQAWDKGLFPIETCLYNFTQKAFEKTFHQISHSLYIDPEKLVRWGQAFNRKLIANGESLRPMIGRDSWPGYLQNWIPTQDDYPNIDPDTLFREKKPKGRKPNVSYVTIPGIDATEEETKNYYEIPDTFNNSVKNENNER